MIEHLRGQAAYRQQQAKRLSDLARADVGRADALEESLVLVLTRFSQRPPGSRSRITSSPAAAARPSRSTTPRPLIPSG